MDQPPLPVVHNDVVLRLVGEKEDVALAVDDEAMAVIDRCRRTEVPPSGNHPVAETSLPKDGRVCGQDARKSDRSDRSERGAGGRAQSGPEKGTPRGSWQR